MLIYYHYYIYIYLLFVVALYTVFIGVPHTFTLQRVACFSSLLCLYYQRISNLFQPDSYCCNVTCEILTEEFPLSFVTWRLTPTDSASTAVCFLNFSWPTSEGGVSKIRNRTDNMLALRWADTQGFMVINLHVIKKRLLNQIFRCQVHSVTFHKATTRNCLVHKKHLFVCIHILINMTTPEINVYLQPPHHRCLSIDISCELKSQKRDFSSINRFLWMI